MILPPIIDLPITHWIHQYRVRPLLTLSICFGLGTLLGRCSLLAIVVSVFAVTLVSSVCSVRRNTYAGYIMLVFLMIGLGRSWIAWNPGNSDISRIADGRGYQIIGPVIDEFGDTNSRTLILRIDPSMGKTNGLWTGTIAIPTMGKGKDIDVGDIIQTSGRVSLPSTSRNEGGFDRSEFLKLHGAWCELVLLRSSKIEVVNRASLTDSPSRVAHVIKRTATRNIDRSLNPLSASIVEGLLFGAKAKIPAILLDDFAATGTIHILATAGLHIGILTILLLSLFKLIRIPLRPRVVLTALIILGFVLVAGSRPAVTRAGIMAAVALASMLFNRTADRITLLALAGSIILWLNPAEIFEPGFQMTFATVSVLIAFTKPYLLWLKPFKESHLKLGSHDNSLLATLSHNFAGLLYVSFFAMIGSWPIVAQYFHEFSVISVVANLFVVPVVGLLFIGGIVVAITAPIVQPIAIFFGFHCIPPVVRFLIGTVSLLARIPYAVIAVPSPGWIIITIYYGMLLYIAAKFPKPLSTNELVKR